MSPRRKRKERTDRLLDALKVVCGFDDDSKKIVDIFKQQYWFSKDVDNEYGPHTLIKLMFLWYYTDIAVKIANKHFEKLVFIDTFSGGGLVKIENTDHICLGSPLIPVVSNLKMASKGKKGFDEIILIDSDKNKVDLLKSRLDAIVKNLGLKLKYTTLTGDSNDLILSKQVLDSVDRTTYILIFIDPEGLEPKLPSYLELVDKVSASDIILNASWGLRRLARTSLAEKLITQYLGKYDTNLSIEQQLDEVFIKEFGKKVGVGISVKDINNRHLYTLMLRVRRTKSGSEWIEGMKGFVDNVLSKYTANDVKSFLDQLAGKQASIDKFLK